MFNFFLLFIQVDLLPLEMSLVFLRHLKIKCQWVGLGRNLNSPVVQTTLTLYQKILLIYLL